MIRSLSLSHCKMPATRATRDPKYPNAPSMKELTIALTEMLVVQIQKRTWKFIDRVGLPSQEGERS
jgi:hypothetical protein